MKKKLLGIIMAMVLVFAYAVPVAATEAEQTVPETATESAASAETNTISDDEQIQAAFEAYEAMMEAFKVNEPGPMTDAYNQLNEITMGFTEEQSEEWTEIVENNIGIDEYLSNTVTVATIIYVIELKEDYLANPNSSTAYEFVTYYDDCVESGVNMEAMEPGIGAVYEMAKSVDMPSENVINVYEAHTALAEALAWGYNEDFVNTCKDFEAVLDAFNSLTEDELKDLAELMGAETADDAWNTVFTDWVNANMILQIGEAYDAYINNPNEANAQAFVEAYELVLNDDTMLTDDDKEIILASFSVTYEDAKSLLTDSDVESEPATKDDKSSSDTTPATGDDSNMLIPFAVMLVAAITGIITMKRRKTEE